MDTARQKVLEHTGEKMPFILIVEDYEDALDLLSELLAFRGYRIEGAKSGAEAIEKATRLLPDVVLMDLTLPDMDGLAATRTLKASERTKHIPIIALTAHSQSAYIESARAAGCDGFVTKPCMPDALVEHVKRVLAPKTAPT